MKNLLKNTQSSVAPTPSKSNPSKKFSFSFEFLKSKKMQIALASILSVILFVLILGYIFIFMPAMKLKASAQAVADEATLLKADLKSNDIDLIEARINSVAEKYTAFEKDAEALYWTTIIPYGRDFKAGVEAGRYMIQAADESITAIYPYADLIGFKQGETNFYDKSAKERLQTAVITLDKMLERIDVVADNIEQAEKRIESIDPNRYPEKIGDKEVRANIVAAKDQFKGMASLFVDAKPLLKELPAILGAEEEKDYLILFQNTAERRATGGFFTFYAIFNVNKGEISVKGSSDMYDIDNSIAVHPPAPDKILKYHKNVTKFYIRDSNLSPDFVESVALFDSLYQKAGSSIDYDGIIAIDSKVLVDMLRIFGDTQVDGINFSAEIDERCDCPQVIYTLFDIVDRPVNYVKIDRKRILGNLMLELFYKAIGFSPSKYWGQLAQTSFENLDEKHILLYFIDKDTQTAVEQMDYAGRIQDVEGDYLHINSVNFAGAKSNMFIDETVTSATTFEGGLVKREVKIKFKNPHPASDCNLERGGLCLNATLRNWIRFYVPEGSKLVNFAGSKTKTLTYDELGKTVYEGFMTLDPEGVAEVSITYTLPSNITKDNYTLYVQKQAGVENQELSVEINGNKEFEGPFKVDTHIE